MSLDACYIKTQIDLLEVHLALADEGLKRSGDFETTYTTGNGKEITVKRSPDGKFAHKGSGVSSQESNAVTTDTGKTIGKVISGFADDLAKMPAKVQDAAHKAMFDSDLSRVINKQAEKFIKSAYDPGLAAGFKLGQNIKDELAKKPFSEFGRIVADKFAEFRKELPQKTDDLKKEIVRIAKDPNTSTTVAVGVLLGLAGYFHVTALLDGIKAGGAAYHLTKILPALRAGQLDPSAGAAAIIVNGAAVVGNLISGTIRNIAGAILTSEAGRTILKQTNANAKAENDRLKKELAATKGGSEELTRQYQDQQEKDAVAKEKLIKKLQEDSPKTPDEIVSTDGTPNVIKPVFSIKLSEEDEAYVADPENYKAVVTEAWKDAELLKLTLAQTEAVGLELIAAFAGEEKEEKKFHEIAKQASEEMEKRLTAVIKKEIARQRAEKNQ